jgi:hypothetical protein
LDAFLAANTHSLQSMMTPSNKRKKNKPNPVVANAAAAPLQKHDKVQIRLPNNLFPSISPAASSISRDFGAASAAVIADVASVDSPSEL